MLRPAPSDAAIAEFEALIEMPLPVELKRLLAFSNGGHPELDTIEGVEGAYAVNHFLHLTAEDKGGSRSMWRAFEEWRPILGSQAIPFAETGGGDPFFLNVADSPPTVKICRHHGDMQVAEVAPTFEAFIDRLALNPDYI